MNTEFAYTQHLLQAGLTHDEAALYEVLVKEGKLPASSAARRAKVSRTLAYKVLADLEKRGLVEREDIAGAASTFTAAHPAKLREIADKQAKEAENAKLAIDGIINPLSSDFNLAVGKPGIRFFAGDEGVQEVLNDSLNSKEEIRAYSDLSTIHKYAQTVSNEYIKRRTKLSVRRRSLMPGTEENRALVAEKYTGKLAELSKTRFLNCDKTPFGTYMQIYDGKIAYIAFSGGNLIGAIIEDERIYTLHKTLFDHMWNVTPQ